MCATPGSAAFALYAGTNCSGPPLSTTPFDPVSAGFLGWGCTNIPGQPYYTSSGGVCVTGNYTPATGVGYRGSTYFPAPQHNQSNNPALALRPAATGLLQGALADAYCPVPQTSVPYSVTSLPVGTCFAPYTTAYTVSQLVGCSGGMQTNYQYTSSA